MDSLSTTTTTCFVLKGAAIASRPPEATSNITGMKRGQQRKTPSRLKMQDDPKLEGMLETRRTTLIPSFAMLDKEGETYPERVDDRLCQWDHYPITWLPLGLPISRFVINKKPHFVCVRWFCSLECAKIFFKKYCKDDPTFANTFKYLEEMNKLTLAYLKQPYTSLEDAQDWNVLKLVGSGTMEIDDFRAPWGHKYQKILAFVLYRGVEAYTRRIV